MKISIITAAWNSGATIRDTMLSVLAQTYPDIEHIVVDGASHDNTLDIVRELEPRYAGRLRWISEKDKGIYDAMNKGLSMATGDVVGILNSDDFFSDAKVIERAVEHFSDDIDAVYGDIHFVNANDLDFCVRYYSSAVFTRWMMLLGYQPAHPSFYCRKTIYEKHGYFDTDFKIAADFEHLLRVIYVNNIRTKYLPMDFVTMRTGGASTAGIKSHMRIYMEHLKAYRKNGINTAMFLDHTRYFFKSLELLWQKLH